MEVLITSSLLQVLYFKLSERNHNKHNKFIYDHCDILIEILKNSNDTLGRLKLLNCNAVKVTLECLEYCCRKKSKMEINRSDEEQFQAIKIGLERCLNYFDVVIEPYDSYHTFDKLSKTLCKALEYILKAAKYEETSMTIYENVMKLNFSSLYEIIEMRSTHKDETWYDTLMKVNSKALKEILEAKKNLMDKCPIEMKNELVSKDQFYILTQIYKIISEYLDN